MRQFSEFNTPDADTLIITCLNTAYYICTVAAVADNRGDFNIDNIWAGVREVAFGTVNHDQEKYQKIIFSLVMVLIERSTRNVQILSSLTNKIHKYMHDKYASNSHIEYSIFMHDTNNTILHEDTFEPINIIQALELDSTNIISVVRGFGYIEECIRRINDHGVQKHVLNLALSKFDHQWYHDNEVDSVKWRLESMRDHIKSYSAPKVPPYHDKNIPNQKKKAHEKQHNLFEKTQKFVEDTQYFCSVIKSEQFYDRNGYFYQETKERFDSYCDVNEDEFVKEVNNSPLQTYFDDYKKLLNSIVIPDLDTFSMSKYIQENLTSDRELLEDALEIFETVVEKCGNLRNSVENFMELYDLKDNYPKIGFLRPIFIDEAITEDNDEFSSEEKEIKQTNTTHPNNVIELFSSKDTCDDFFGEDNLDCAGWARRAWKFCQESKLYFHMRGDKKLLYEELKRLHPKIAQIGTFTHTINDLNNKAL